MKTYSDQICDWLVEQGYTHCFFVAGGNVMHLLNSARSRFKCIPVVHEVSAGIATEYFNELDSGESTKAFALVTAGPGLTNIVTAIAGAHMESRSLLVIGGQVKSSDLANGEVRQRGIQEIEGVPIVKSLCKVSRTLVAPISKSEFINLISQTHFERKGVVFLEVCLDVQAIDSNEKLNNTDTLINNENYFLKQITPKKLKKVKKMLLNSERPIILIGGGVDRNRFTQISSKVTNLGVPLMATWNGADRIPFDSDLNWGRPNTWGMRYSNILIQQADLIIAVGTRLGLQQTGFNWQEFAPLAKVVQVDIDKSELEKGHPKTHLKIHADANDFLEKITSESQSNQINIDAWKKFGERVKNKLPLSDPQNNNFTGYWNPYDFIELLSRELKCGDSLIPSSSGAAETVTMQTAAIPKGVFVVTDKGMASMGYGLAGAIGAAFKTKNRVLHIEGDGGFAQNLQELGTVKINNLPIKIFIFDNGGYASIRMTQRSYFNGNIVGCDEDSGLGLPKWETLFEAYGIQCKKISAMSVFDPELLGLLGDDQPRAFLVPIHPDQTYFPKITSKVLPDGKMASNPLHLMTPDLSAEQVEECLPYLKDRI